MSNASHKTQDVCAGACKRKANKSEFDRLAHEIANSTAAADIESFCNIQKWSGPHFGIWYEIPAESDEFENECVQRAVRYLGMQGRLQRHPECPELVRFA